MFAKKKNLNNFGFRENVSTLKKFIGYVDWTDFGDIWHNISARWSGHCQGIKLILKTLAASIVPLLTTFC